jgi:hypothetical protein
MGVFTFKDLMTAQPTFPKTKIPPDSSGGIFYKVVPRTAGVSGTKIKRG